MGRLDLDFAELHRANPRIVHCSISGYGATGPLSRKATTSWCRRPRGS
jgi:crotonobetainyl-CoA:carnitine CoA-transferase CaiB-like acyl-CoA transferase